MTLVCMGVLSVYSCISILYSFFIHLLKSGLHTEFLRIMNYDETIQSSKHFRP